MPLIVGGAYAKAALTRSDPRHFLFFNRNPTGKRAAADYMARLKERTADRDKPISQQARIAQLMAIREAGLGEPHDLSKITQPTFVANGDNDVMVASSQSRVLAERIPERQADDLPGLRARRHLPVPRAVRPRASWSSFRPTTRSPHEGLRRRPLQSARSHSPTCLSRRSASTTCWSTSTRPA